MGVEISKFIPKKIAQKCPVCNGFGTLASGRKVCQACDGKCYIIVDQTEGKTEHELETTNTN